MKKINTVHLGKPSAQWKAWIRKLSEAGFEIKAVDTLAMELQSFSACPDDVILLHGMLPHLHRIIARTCARHPEAPIIVATEFDHFSINDDALHLDGVIFVSGPMALDRFVTTIREIVSHGQIAAA